MKHTAEVSLTPRNGTVDFLLYPREADSKGIEVRVQDRTVWLNQAGMAELYQIDRSVITKHIRHIYQAKEQVKDATCAKFAQVADNGINLAERNYTGNRYIIAHDKSGQKLRFSARHLSRLTFLPVKSKDSSYPIS